MRPLGQFVPLRRLLRQRVPLVILILHRHLRKLGYVSLVSLMLRRLDRRAELQ
jgi:hypothetical protein